MVIPPFFFRNPYLGHLNPPPCWNPGIQANQPFPKKGRGTVQRTKRPQKAQTFQKCHPTPQQAAKRWGQVPWDPLKRTVTACTIGLGGHGSSSSSQLLGCLQEVSRWLVNELKPQYTPFISRWNNPFTNHLLTSWDIQVACHDLQLTFFAALNGG